MSNLYPGALNNYTTGSGSPTLVSAGHADEHNQLEKKLGTGSSTPVANTVLRGTGTGTSAYQQVNLTTDVTGVLPTANGGTGVVVLTQPATAATITIANNKTLTANNSLTLAGTDGKTLTVNNSLTIAGTDGTTMTFPSSSDTVVTLTATQTLTNKRRTRRVVTTTQSATPTINTDNTDVAVITGLAQAITSFTTNLSGTPVDGDLLEIDITDNGTARALTFGASFKATTVALPTTTVISTKLNILFKWSAADSAWLCVATA